MLWLIDAIKDAGAPAYTVLKRVAAKFVGEQRAELLMRYAVFVFGGTLGLGIKAGVTYVLSRFGWGQMLAYSVGLALNIVFNFVFHRTVTFNVKTDWQRRFAVFAAVTSALVAADWLLVYVFAELLGNNIYITIFLVTLFLSVINFSLNKLIIFRTAQDKSL